LFVEELFSDDIQVPFIITWNGSINAHSLTKMC
jgi:hypothetical protein